MVPHEHKRTLSKQFSRGDVGHWRRGVGKSQGGSGATEELRARDMESLHAVPNSGVTYADSTANGIAWRGGWKCAGRYSLPPKPSAWLFGGTGWKLLRSCLRLTRWLTPMKPCAFGFMFLRITRP